MIVRIATEGQYKVNSALLDRLNELDDRLVQVVAGGDQGGFASVLSEMLALVRTEGTPIAAEELVVSDVILPAPDTSLEEARSLVIGDGLVPD